MKNTDNDDRDKMYGLLKYSESKEEYADDMPFEDIVIDYISCFKPEFQEKRIADLIQQLQDIFINKNDE